LAGFLLKNPWIASVALVVAVLMVEDTVPFTPSVTADFDAARLLWALPLMLSVGFVEAVVPAAAVLVPAAAVLVPVVAVLGTVVTVAGVAAVRAATPEGVVLFATAVALGVGVVETAVEAVAAL
jgi:hypothetical protein